MPLGKISKKNLTKAYKILTNCQKVKLSPTHISCQLLSLANCYQLSSLANCYQLSSLANCHQLSSLTNCYQLSSLANCRQLSFIANFYRLSAFVISKLCCRIFYCVLYLISGEQKPVLELFIQLIFMWAIVADLLLNNE